VTQHGVSCAALADGCTSTLFWVDDQDDVDPDRMAGYGWDLVDDLWTCPLHVRTAGRSEAEHWTAERWAVAAYP
jgi:hypothetical protein